MPGSGSGTMQSYPKETVAPPGGANPSLLDRVIVGIGVTVMLGKIASGLAFGSAALLANGCHLMTHAGSLVIVLLASSFSRRYQDDPRFSFGPGKMGDLTLFAIAVSTAASAIVIIIDATRRLLVEATPIDHDLAIQASVAGLAADLFAAALILTSLRRRAAQGLVLPTRPRGADAVLAATLHPARAAHAPLASHRRLRRLGHDAAPEEQVFAMAPIQALLDVFMSLLAILALLASLYAGFDFLDPLVAILTALLILRWAWLLIEMTGAMLLDAVELIDVETILRNIIDAENGVRIDSLRLWRPGAGRTAALVFLIADHPQPPAYYRRLILASLRLNPLVIEVHPRLTPVETLQAR